MKINWTGKPIVVSSGPVAFSSGAGGVAGGVAGGAGGNITLYGGAHKPSSGNQNIVIGNSGSGAYLPDNVFTVFSEDHGEWMKYKNETNKAEVKLSSGWVLIEPRGFKDMHQLDLGSAVDTKGKEDLAEIREQYEEHIKKSPWLEKLRNDYDELLEKHKLFDAIKGDDGDA